MVITKKYMETKEIEIPGFREILKNSKHPDYKELRIYIKNGWIPVDPEDDEKEMQKAKQRKLNAKKNKERRPTYKKMEERIQKLNLDDENKQKMLKEFNKKKEIKNNYNNILKWYNEEMRNIQNEDIKEGAKGEGTGADTIQPDTEKGAKGKVK